MSWKVKNGVEHIECSLCKSPDIYLEVAPRQKIELLMEAYPSQEWLGYLKGRISEKKNVFVEDLEIPPHKEANGASAEAEPFHIPKDCVGIIHSHHSMGAFHSGTDQTYVDKNFPVSITVARRTGQLEFDAVSYTVTLCGKATTGKSTVKYVQPKPLFDTEVWLSEAKGNIDKGKRVTTIVSSSGYYLDGKFVSQDPEYWQGEYNKYTSRGKYKKSKDNYLPIKYRQEVMKGFVTDKNGRVLNKEELDDILYNSSLEG